MTIGDKVPTYTYTCVTCDKRIERLQPMEQRDNAYCHECGYKLIRGLDRPGLVWSPTRNGGYS